MALTVRILDAAGNESTLDLAVKEFSTGSKGFYAQGKLGITLGSEVRITVQNGDGKVVDSTVAPLRRFSTGSYGYHVQGKLAGASGIVYQYQTQAIVVGSKYSATEPTGYVTCQCQSQAVVVGSKAAYNGQNAGYSNRNGAVS